MNSSFVSLTALLLIPALTSGAEQKTVRAPLQAAAARKAAPTFQLLNSHGNSAGPATYRGKVILLDLWATECGGCKAEIPYFMELSRAYRSRELVVLGVSLDILYEDLKDAKEAWSRVIPFAQAQKINYPILMGDEAFSKLFHVQEMPATYLIDKRGRIAATYIGVVDKNDLDSNIKKLLTE